MRYAYKEDDNLPAQCFTPIQHKTLVAATGHPANVQHVVKLCPSMDLLVLGLTMTTTEAGEKYPNDAPGAAERVAPTLAVFRSVTWQKLAAVVPSSIDTDNSKLLSEKPLITNCCWSPNGQHLAALVRLSHPQSDINGSIQRRLCVFSIEQLLAGNNSGGGGGGGGDDGSAVIAAVRLADSVVLDTVWAHGSSPHPQWTATSSLADGGYDNVNRLACYYQQHTHLLPPSQYHESLKAWQFPSPRTPLSVLALLRQMGTKCELQLLLQGRVPFVVLPAGPWQLGPYERGNSSKESKRSPHCTPQILPSLDLAHWAVLMQSETGTLRLHISTVPTLRRHRRVWQAWAAHFCRVEHHLRHINRQLPLISQTFANAIKPLDAKLMYLQNLLQKYQAHDDATSLPAILQQHVLAGEFGLADENLANALDQFWTSGQCNDVLLTRLERSLTVALSSLESAWRQHVVAPCDALLLDADAIQGLAAAHPHHVRDLTEIHAHLRGLVQAAHVGVAVWVQVRARVDDLLRWMRATAAHTRAKGTAQNSVQRELATKKQVHDAVTHRLLKVWRQAVQQLADGVDAVITPSLQMHHPPAPPQRQLMEKVLGIDLRPLWTVNKNHLQTKKACEMAPFVADHLHRIDAMLTKVARYDSNSVPPVATPTGIDVANQHSGEIALPFAATMRVGCGGNTEDNDAYMNVNPKPAGYFGPSARLAPHVKQWMVMAQVQGKEARDIVLSCLPLTWMDDVDWDLTEEQEVVALTSPMFGRTVLQLPSGCCIRQIAFYGNDGKSSLANANDDETGTGQEDRQALALIVQRHLRRSLELWLLPYDHVTFGWYDMEHGNEQGLMRMTTWNQPVPCCGVQPRGDVMHGRGYQHDMVWARTRVLPTTMTTPSMADTALHVNGSRGMAAVLSASDCSGTVLELLDLEEDEEEAVDDDDE